jgi:peptide deformylase
MKSDKVILLGDPRLHLVSEPVEQHEVADLMLVVQDLHDILFEFKARFAHYGAFRAIAAPQIGAMKRLIYMNIDNQATIFFNPEITFLSPETFEVWDDCMCFPNLLVRLKRHKICHVRYRDAAWQEHNVIFEGSLSELFQHEYDHLDGILATQKAIDNQSFRWRN